VAPITQWMPGGSGFQGLHNFLFSWRWKVVEGPSCTLLTRSFYINGHLTIKGHATSLEAVAAKVQVYAVAAKKDSRAPESSLSSYLVEGTASTSVESLVKEKVLLPAALTTIDVILGIHCSVGSVEAVTCKKCRSLQYDTFTSVCSM